MILTNNYLEEIMDLILYITYPASVVTDINKKYVSKTDIEPSILSFRKNQ